MPSAETAYLFRHAVMRDAARNLHLPSDRARLHGLALDILQALPGLDLDALAPELADHAHGAMDEASPDEQARYAAQEQTFAARAARHAEKNWQLKQACEYWGRVSRHRIQDTGLRNEEIVARARLARMIGEHRQVQEIVSSALAQGADGPTTDLLRLELARAVGAGAQSAEAVQILLQLTTSGRLPPDKHRGALLALGTDLRVCGRLEQADEVLGQCLALSREAGDHVTEGFALLHQMNVLQDRGQMDAVEKAMPEFNALLQRHSNAALEATAGVTLGIDQFRRGHMDSAEALLGRAWKAATDSGQRLQAAIASVNLGVVLLGRHKYSQAIDVLRGAADVAREIGSPRLEQGAMVNIAVALGELGQFAEAERTFGRSLALARQIGDALIISRNLSNLAFSLMAQGDNEGAIGHLQEAQGILDGMGVKDTMDGLRINTNLAQALARTHRLPQARQALARAEACAAAQGVDGSHGNPFTRAHWEQIQKLKKDLGA